MNKNLKLSKIQLPAVIFGTSCLGNIYQAVPYETKKAIVEQCVLHSKGIPVFDTAGKYGAGMALEVLGQALSDLNIHQDEVLISNKLGWVQAPLLTPEPTFEKGIWIDLKHDAVQKISYDGILECFKQGNELLGNYNAQMVSVHDPDEYLAMATNKTEEDKLYKDILEAYRALSDLKDQGAVKSIGIGSKDWKVIKRISEDVELDWVMIANSLTVHSHPQELLDFIAQLNEKNVDIINSAVFNGGFLIGSDFYNYQKVDAASPEGKALYAWRDQFYKLCNQFEIQPAEACFNFGFNIPGVKSIALSTTKPEKVKGNITMADKKIPAGFWKAMEENGLIKNDLS